MLGYLTFILTCQLLGELAVKAAELPIPGPVVGMLLLFAFLVIRGRVPDNLAKTADGLLSHLSLLFVPAGVGVILHFQLLGGEWVAFSTALVASTLATIVVTGLLMSWLDRKDGGTDEVAPRLADNE